MRSRAPCSRRDARPHFSPVESDATSSSEMKTNKPLFSPPLVAILLLIPTVAITTRAIINREAAAESKSTPAPPATAESSKAIFPTDGQLAQLIDQTIDGSEFASARWGVFVTALNDGRVLYARNADKLFTPASNMKIYTT